MRERYPTTHPSGKRDVGTNTRRHPLPPEPTNALPGRSEKVDVLASRAARGTNSSIRATLLHGVGAVGGNRSPCHGTTANGRRMLAELEQRDEESRQP
jgi:hypothetical protein